MTDNDDSGNEGTGNIFYDYLSSDEFKYRDYNPSSLAGKLMTDDVDFLNSLDPTNPPSGLNYNPYLKSRS